MLGTTTWVHIGLLLVVCLCVVSPSELHAQTADVTTATHASDSTATVPSSAGTAPIENAPHAPASHASFGLNRRDTVLASLTIFVLAIFLGFELINKVPPTLHTPLMSGSNAISGITLVGALIATGTKTHSWLVPALGVLAVVMATVNAVGGFAVTHRMLVMFRRK